MDVMGLIYTMWSVIKSWCMLVADTSLRQTTGASPSGVDHPNASWDGMIFSYNHCAQPSICAQLKTSWNIAGNVMKMADVGILLAMVVGILCKKRRERWKEKVSYGNMGMVTKKMGKGTFRQFIPLQTWRVSKKVMQTTIYACWLHQFQKLTLKCHNTPFLSHCRVILKQVLNCEDIFQVMNICHTDVVGLIYTMWSVMKSWCMLVAHNSQKQKSYHLNWPAKRVDCIYISRQQASLSFPYGSPPGLPHCP